MHAGQTDEAGALASRMGKDIARRCSGRLTNIDGKLDSKKFVGSGPAVHGTQTTRRIGSITAGSLNQYYAAISGVLMLLQPRCGAIIAVRSGFWHVQHIRPNSPT